MYVCIDVSVILFSALQIRFCPRSDFAAYRLRQDEHM